MKADAREVIYREAVDFLEQLRPGGPWVLTAIHPMERTVKTITASDSDAVRTFVRANDGKKNLYFSVNPTRTVMTTKAAKVDIAAIEYLLADLDPEDDERPEAAKERYLKAIDAQEPAPTAIIDSGNGIQGLWRLAEPIKLASATGKDAKGEPEFPSETAEIIAQVEGRSKALMKRLGSKAGTQNIDRVLRIPGTINLPNKTKLKKGRVICPTKLIRFNDATCTLEDFPPALDDTNSEQDKSSTTASNIDALPISKRIRDLIHGIDDPEHPYPSRSEAVFAVIVAMVAAGCADDQIEVIFLDPNCPISAHVLEQPQSQKYLARQIAKARKAAVEPRIAKLNETYALVIVGDKTAIMKSVADGGIKFLAHSAFELWHANRFIYYQDKNGDQKKISLAKYWLRHPQRRQYEGIVFAPGREVAGHFNLWRGYAVQPQPGDCSKFLAHLKDNVCRGDESLFPWVIGWIAQIVQQPDKKMGTSLVLRGKQGTGKTKVGEVIGSLLGEHYALVSDPRYVTGRFNSHLLSCLLLHCDESFWAGDHAAEGKLKDLITGGHHFIEYKGREPIRVRNYVRLLVTGNPDWLVPAGFEERRFAVLDVGEDHMQDKAYFAAIDAEMNNGGREALLDFLLKFDLTSIDLRTIPTTAALLDQKLASLTPELGWWLDTLAQGELPWGLEEPGRCPTSRLFDRYARHAMRHGTRRRSLETQLGRFLRKYVPGLIKNQGTYQYWSGIEMTLTEGMVYAFPPLAECREAFAKTLQQNITWVAKDGWSVEPVPDPTPREGPF
jgi:hypothetical protein